MYMHMAGRCLQLAKAAMDIYAVVAAVGILHAEHASRPGLAVVTETLA